MGWLGITTNAQSSTDGLSNTTTITSILGNNGGTPYAAELCHNYQVDSQGNTPCQAGNTCYNNWILPAQNQLDCLHTNRIAIGGFSTNSYWSSTEQTAVAAIAQSFLNGTQAALNKNNAISVRCIRNFTP